MSVSIDRHGRAPRLARALVWWSVTAAGCSPATEGVGRAAAALTLGPEVTFPSPADVEPEVVAGGIADHARGATSRLVVWQTPSGGATLPTVTARAFSPSWAPLGEPLVVAPDARAPVVAAVGAGFAVAWAEGGGLRVRFLDANGAPMGAAVPVSAVYPSHLAIGATANGAVVAWVDTSSPSAYQLLAARVNAAGAVSAPGGRVVATVATPGNLAYPALACRAAGCLLAWNASNGLTRHDAFAQRLDAEGTPVASPVLRVGAGLRDRYLPRPATNGSDYLVAWHEHGAGVASPGAFARRLNGATGEWLDASPVTLRVLDEDVGTSAADYRSAPAWNGSAWGVLTWGRRRPATFCGVSSSGVAGAPATLPWDDLTANVDLAGDAAGWAGVYAVEGLRGVGPLRRMELTPAGAPGRLNIPVLGGELLPQGSRGFAWAGGRFIVGVTEGLWRVTPAGVREGSAPAPLPAALLASSYTPGGASSPAGIMGRGDRIAVSVSDRVSGNGVEFRAAFSSATLDGFSGVALVGGGTPAAASATAAGPGDVLLYATATNANVNLRAVDLRGVARYGATLPDATDKIALAASSAEALVARTKHLPGPPEVCVDELVLLDASGSPLAVRERARVTSPVCSGAPWPAVAANDASFVVASGRELQSFTGGGAITPGWVFTLPDGDLNGVVWSGSSWVVVTSRAASGEHDLYLQRLSPSGAALDPSPVFALRARSRAGAVSDGAGRVGLVYQTTAAPAGVSRVALRVVDWGTAVDAGVDATVDAAPDARPDAALDGTAEAPRDVAREGPPDAAEDARSEAARDAARDVPDATDVPPADADVPPDAAPTRPAPAGCSCAALGARPRSSVPWGPGLAVAALALRPLRPRRRR